MGVSCNIVFNNNPERIYYSGQDLSGVVTANVNEELRVRKIELIIEGAADCEWTESYEVRRDHEHENRTETRTEHVTYRGYEQYLNSVSLLVATETRIQPGVHTYNFMVHIPETAPSSMHENHGQIRYRVRVKFDRPWSIDDEFHEEFVVVCPIDLNFHPHLRNPAEQTITDEFGCCCCASESVNFTVQIPKTGFAPGEDVELKARIHNPTDTTINYLEVRIMKIVMYESTMPTYKTRHEEIKIMDGTFGEPLTKNTREYAYAFKIPLVSSTTMNPSFRVIQIRYELSVRAKNSGCSSIQDVTIPITIGNVALTDNPIISQPSMMSNTLPQVMPDMKDGFPTAATPMLPVQYPPMNSGIYPTLNNQTTSAPFAPTGGPGYPTATAPTVSTPMAPNMSGPGYPTATAPVASTPFAPPTSGPGYPTATIPMIPALPADLPPSFNETTKSTADGTGSYNHPMGFATAEKK